MKKVFISFALFFVSSLSSGLTADEINHLISLLRHLKATANVILNHPYTNSMDRHLATDEITVCDSYLKELYTQPVSRDMYIAVNNIIKTDIAWFSEKRTALELTRLISLPNSYH